MFKFGLCGYKTSGLSILPYCLSIGTSKDKVKFFKSLEYQFPTAAKMNYRKEQIKTVDTYYLTVPQFRYPAAYGQFSTQGLREGKTRFWPWVALLSPGSGEESASKFILVVGEIQFLEVVGMTFLFSCYYQPLASLFLVCAC